MDYFYLAFAEKMQRFFIFRGVEMLIGGICSSDLFETSWEGLHEVLPTAIAEESRMFSCVLCCLSGVVIVTLNRSYPAYERHREIMASFSGVVLVEMILTPMHILRSIILA